MGSRHDGMGVQGADMMEWVYGEQTCWNECTESRHVGMGIRGADMMEWVYREQA